MALHAVGPEFNKEEFPEGAVRERVDDLILQSSAEGMLRTFGTTNVGDNRKRPTSGERGLTPSAKPCTRTLREWDGKVAPQVRGNKTGQSNFANRMRTTRPKHCGKSRETEKNGDAQIRTFQ